MWTIWRAPTNASKWRMGFNLAFKGLNKSGPSKGGASGSTFHLNIAAALQDHAVPQVEKCILPSLYWS